MIDGFTGSIAIAPIARPVATLSVWVTQLWPLLVELQTPPPAVPTKISPAFAPLWTTAMLSTRPELGAPSSWKPVGPVAIGAGPSGCQAPAGPVVPEGPR